MMRLFKRKHKKKGLFPDFFIILRSITKPVVDKTAIYLRYHGRARLLNRWGRHHPRKLMGGYIATALLLLFYTAISSLFHMEESPENAIKESFPTDIRSTFSNFGQIRSNEEAIRHQLGIYGNQVILMAAELDSLVKINKKSHQDSVRIASLYNTLNSTLNTNTDHEIQLEKN